jgi:nucleotide-binding universal stress UspA family protein
MFPIEKIFCPTDFSEPSYEALKVAEELASQFSSELTLIHVVSPIPSVPDPAASTGSHLMEILKEIEASAEKNLNKVIQEKISGEIQTRIMVVQGNPADEVARLAAIGNADLIVMATHGMTGWKKLVFGSVAEKVIRVASCPVLTIPAPHEEG